jgi:hypothetical protein
VNVLSGRFRRASSDDDLTAIIKGGIPGMAMASANLFLPGLIRGLGDARESREPSLRDERQRRPVGNVTPL